MIQPFDGGGPYDARYDEVIAPAIESLSIEAYRVDRDPTSTIPIDTIERKIRESDYCLADITLDNPNVWYEVGYGMACGRDVILLCSRDRQQFPFDVRHRGIIRYGTQSPSNFASLRQSIVERLTALKQTERRILDVSLVNPTEGLSPHEMTALVLILGAMLDPNSVIYSANLKHSMEKALFNESATVLAIRVLMRKKYIEWEPDHDSFGNQCDGYKITDAGLDWCLANQDKLNLKLDPPKPPQPRPQSPPRRPPTPPVEAESDDDDIPF